MLEPVETQDPVATRSTLDRAIADDHEAAHRVALDARIEELTARRDALLTE